MERLFKIAKQATLIWTQPSQEENKGVELYILMDDTVCIFDHVFPNCDFFHIFFNNEKHRRWKNVMSVTDRNTTS